MDNSLAMTDFIRPFVYLLWVHKSSTDRITAMQLIKAPYCFWNKLANYNILFNHEIYSLSHPEHKNESIETSSLNTECAV